MWYIITVVIFIALLWVLSMYRLWKYHYKANLEEGVVVQEKVSATARALRKCWFAFERGMQSVRALVTRYATKLFFFLFPKAKDAFIPKDELTGLKDGPSSYFLMSVSEYKAEAKKPARRKRKIV